MLKLLSQTQSSDGRYPSLYTVSLTSQPDKTYLWPDDLDDTAYYTYSGFIIPTIENNIVVSYEINTDAWAAWRSSDTVIQGAVSSKLTEISEACSTTIISGVDAETSNGTDHFNLSTEDQSNITNLFNLVMLGGTEFPYQADGGACTIYTAEDITAIYVAAQTLITSQITYHNLLKSYVQSLTDLDAIQEVTYGQDLADDYLEEYTSKMTIAQTQLENILAKLS